MELKDISYNFKYKDIENIWHIFICFSSFLLQFLYENIANYSVSFGVIGIPRPFPRIISSRLFSSPNPSL